MIVAGEASGDLHGSMLVREMRALDPSLQFFGIGGNKMKEAGVDLIASASEIGVVGATEVLTKAGTFLRVIRQVSKSLDAFRPDLVILIDFPDFNLNIVARAAKKRGVKVFYYISPQVWAWRQGRIEQIKRLVDKMAVILPFEVEVYARRGFSVDYVGHPLVDTVKSTLSKSEARKLFGLKENKTTIGLLPGSRDSEISRLLPEMIRAAKLILKRRPDVQYILPLADTLKEESVQRRMDAAVPVKIVPDRTYDVIACCDLAIVTSGTATLETGLLGVPMVIIYKLSLLSALIGRLFIRVDHIGLVNIIAGKTIVPELIQLDAKAEKIAEEALAILTDEKRRTQMISDLSDLRSRMGEAGAARRAAQIAYDMI
jgi:lipid-A-disaccharide synthase